MNPWSPIRRRRGTDFLIVPSVRAAIGGAAARSVTQSAAQSAPGRAPTGAAGRGPTS
ncbi:hypothetical protein [Actinomyces oris]|uniref:hypothetical protein n=1 Tax=Actinomyces oris TaxID=544580 RepID=UPI0015BC2ACD|nr:hypothetical protein [Actinomyces oris]